MEAAVTRVTATGPTRRPRHLRPSDATVASSAAVCSERTSRAATRSCGRRVEIASAAALVQRSIDIGSSRPQRTTVAKTASAAIYAGVQQPRWLEDSRPMIPATAFGRQRRDSSASRSVRATRQSRQRKSRATSAVTSQAPSPPCRREPAVVAVSRLTQRRHLPERRRSDDCATCATCGATTAPKRRPPVPSDRLGRPPAAATRRCLRSRHQPAKQRINRVTEERGVVARAEGLV